MSLNKNQQDHFNQWLEKIWGSLSHNNTSKEIIEKAKHDLLDLFIDDNAGLTTHEDVNKAFDHMKTLLDDKIEKATKEEEKDDFMKLKQSINRSQKTYNKPDTFIWKDNNELWARTQQIKEIYDKIVIISHSSSQTDVHSTEDKTKISDKKEQDKQSPTQPITASNDTTQADNDNTQPIQQSQTQQEELGWFVTDTTDTIKQEEKEKSPQDSTIGKPEDKTSEEKDYINELFQKIKFLKELNYLAARCDKTPNSDTGEIQKIREQYNTLLDKNINYAQDPQNKTDLEIQRQKDFIEKKLNNINTTENIQEHTKKEILDLFTIDANVMDKENLIEESERNRIRDLSERKYMEANWLQKVKMFGIDRRIQNKRLRQSMDSQRDTNNFIESWHLQDRIDGNIGTYAQQNKMGIDWWNIRRIDLWNDNQIDEIAHSFLIGNITKEQAISEFNITFNNNPRLRMGSMTGTDIMAQLGNAEFQKTYKIKQLLFPFIDSKKRELSDTDIVSIQQQLNTNKINIVGNHIQANTSSVSAEDIRSSFESLKSDLISKNINQLTDNTTKIRVKLRWIAKRPETEELEGVRYDTLENTRREKVAKFFHRWSAWSLWAKAWLGIGLWLAGAPALWVVAGVTSLWMLLQRARTRRDAIKEIAKTQEDAINMGMGEWDNRMTSLLKAKDDATEWRHKVFNFFWFGSYHRTLKQLKILEAFQQMRANDNTIVSVDKVINDLKTTTTDIRPLADVLARIDAGQQYQTHFISTTDVNGISLGRDKTAIKRNEMMKELQEACFRMGFIEKRENIEPEEWQEVRSQISSTPHYQKTIKELSTTYEQVQQDIITNKNSIARNAAGNYAKSVLAASAVTAGVTGIIHGLSNNANDIATEIKPHEHTNYKLGKFDDNGIINDTHTSGLDQIQNGQTIEIQGESAVDAVQAHSSQSFWNYMDHIRETRELISDSGLNSVTQETLQNAISDDKIQEIIDIAKDAGADEWNRRLVVERWREGMENITEYLSSHNMKDVTIKDIVFDPDTAKMAIQSSIGWADTTKPWFEAIRTIQSFIGWADTTHRGFEAIVKVVSNNEVKDIPRSIPWVPWLLAALPFANTYALPGQEADFTSLNPQTVAKRRKRWQLRKSDSSPWNNRWEHKHAA